MWLTTTSRDLFDPLFDDLWSGDQERSLEKFSPGANIVEKKDRYELDVYLPGVQKEDIDIDVSDNTLTVSGERKKEHEEEKENYYHYESAFGKFSRSWKLDGVDINNINADFTNGVLKIDLPKLEPAEKKQIDIK